MPTPIFGFDTIDDDDNYAFDTLVNGVVTSIENKLPHRFVSSISALNALSNTTLYPNGQIAVLTATSSGVNAGAIFTRAGNRWLFTAGTISNLGTFVSALSSNVGTQAGATFYDTGSATTRVFTNSSGNSEVLIGGSTWTNISYKSGYQQWGLEAPLGYRLVPGGAMLRGTIRRSNGKAIATGAVIASIPALARPSYASRFLASGAGASIGNLTIGVNGDVILYAPISRTSNYYILDGCFLPQS